MKYKILHACISVLLICLSFLAGYYFHKDLAKQEQNKKESEMNRIDLTLSGKTLGVQKSNPDLQIYLDGKLIRAK